MRYSASRKKDEEEDEDAPNHEGELGDAIPKKNAKNPKKKSKKSNLNSSQCTVSSISPQGAPLGTSTPNPPCHDYYAFPSTAPWHVSPSSPWQASASAPWQASASAPWHAAPSAPWHAAPSAPWQPVPSTPWQADPSAPWQAAPLAHWQADVNYNTVVPFNVCDQWNGGFQTHQQQQNRLSLECTYRPDLQYGQGFDGAAHCQEKEWLFYQNQHSNDALFIAIALLCLVYLSLTV
jgi:hypothetical protein